MGWLRWQAAAVWKWSHLNRTFPAILFIPQWQTRPLTGVLGMSGHRAGREWAMTICSMHTLEVGRHPTCVLPITHTFFPSIRLRCCPPLMSSSSPGLVSNNLKVMMALGGENPSLKEQCVGFIGQTDHETSPCERIYVGHETFEFTVVPGGPLALPPLNSVWENLQQPQQHQCSSCYETPMNWLASLYGGRPIHCFKL